MNNQQPLESKNIKISGAEDVGWGIKLKSETGEIFNVPKLKKDTQDKTVAFKTLEMLNGWGMGLTKNVKFATVPNKQGGNSKYVRMIGEPEVASNENMGAEQDNRPNQVKTTSDPQNKPSSSGYSQPPNFLKPENTYNQEKPNWEEINGKKRQDIKWMNAINNSCLLVAKGYVDSDTENKNAKILITELANFIYKLEPNNIPTGDESFNQPLGNNGEEIIPDGQREDMAELNEEDIKIPF